MNLKKVISFARASARSSPGGQASKMSPTTSNLTATSFTWKLAILALVLHLAASHLVRPAAAAADEEKRDEESFFAKPGVRPLEILEARGFLAEEKYFTTTDGYVIRMTRGWSPLFDEAAIAERAPILFVHGVLEADSVFVINSFDVRPKDLSNFTLAGRAADECDQLIEQLAKEPSAKALPFLAMNMRREIWLMSRRGFFGSQEMAGDPLSVPESEADETRSETANRDFSLFDSNIFKPLQSALAAFLNFGSIAQQVPFSFDRKFWKFSFDEQAKWDFPQAVNFVLKQTGAKRVSVVTHSAGGAIQLMALSLYPSLADKIESSVLWAQGFSLGHDDVFNSLKPLQSFFEHYIGSVPPSFATTQIQSVAGLFCASPLAQSTLCEVVADFALGFSNGHQPMRPEFINTLLYPTSAREIAQNLQMIPSGRMRFYNNGPFYNASAIRARNVFFMAGATDVTVSAADVRATLPLLTVPYKYRLIDTTFNHNGYFYHEHTARLAIIPSMCEIERASLNQAQSGAEWK